MSLPFSDRVWKPEPFNSAWLNIVLPTSHFVCKLRLGGCAWADFGLAGSC
jgi:hypothetical protein